MKMQFRYRSSKLDADDPGAGCMRPIVPIKVIGPARKLGLASVLDSGADTTFLPRAIAESVGLDLSGRVRKSRGAGGVFDTYRTTANIEIFSERARLLLEEVPVIVPVAYEPAFVLLGREEIFNKFTIIFEEIQEIVTLRPVS